MQKLPAYFLSARLLNMLLLLITVLHFMIICVPSLSLLTHHFSFLNSWPHFISHVWKVHLCCSSRTYAQLRNSSGPGIYQLAGFTCCQRKKIEAMCQVVFSRSFWHTGLGIRKAVSQHRTGDEGLWAPHQLRDNFSESRCWKMSNGHSLADFRGGGGYQRQCSPKFTQ